MIDSFEAKALANSVLDMSKNIDGINDNTKRIADTLEQLSDTLNNIISITPNNKSDIGDLIGNVAEFAKMWKGAPRQ